MQHSVAKKVILQFLGCLLLCSLVAACSQKTHTPKKTTPSEKAGSFPNTEEIKLTTHDGVQVAGYDVKSDLPNSAPLVVLFHQGGSNARGEYAQIATWLIDNGYNVVAFDLRNGGDLYGFTNETALTLTNQPSQYCDAYIDVETALLSIQTDGPVIVWGSSYSGALVFQAAAKRPDLIDGVIAFSPAAGGPLANCRARQYLQDVSVPAYVLKPESEMSRQSSKEQRDIMVAAGVKFDVIPNGIHGSSLLVDQRTGHDMSNARELVLYWLETRKNESK